MPNKRSSQSKIKGYCKICRQPTQLIFSFGQKPLANAFLSKPEDQEFFYHLYLVFCPVCQLVQLGDTVPPEKMFNDQYHFISSTSRDMSFHFKKLAFQILKLVSKKAKPFVIEIGSNDGIMLRYLAAKGINHLGVEPAGNVADFSQAYQVNVLKAFFNQATARQIYHQYQQADVIYGANTISHIEDLNSVFAGAQDLLKKDGLLIIEDPYFPDIVRQYSFDQIYDEHVFFFSALAIEKLANRHNFSLVKMESQPVHGGSMRYFLQPGKTRKKDPQVESWLKQEHKLNLDKIEGYHNFSRGIDKLTGDLKTMLYKLKKQKQQIVGYGATAKSATLLNYARIGPEILAYISEITPTKIGKFSPGMHIPIKAHQEFQRDRPPYTLLLAWNHQEEILAKEKKYRAQGGKFIVIFPQVRII